MRAARIPSLDGLRAMSIVLVMAGHIGNRFVGGGPFHAIASNSQVGVEVFFAISGFLITTLLYNEKEKTGGISLRSFYVRRAFRILPAFLSYMAVVGALAAMAALKIAPWDYLRSLFLVKDYGPGGAWEVSHIWSLSVEEQFYLFIPALALWLDKRRFFWVAVAVIVTAPLIRVATYETVPVMKTHIGAMFHTRLDAIMWGCLLAMAVRSDVLLQACRKLLKRPVLAASVVYLLLASPVLSERFGGAWTATLGYTLDGAAITLLLFWLVERPTTPIGRALNLGPVVYVGLISYSLYLWQELFLTVRPEEFWTSFPLNIALSMACASASYHLIEQPFLRLRRHLVRDDEVRPIHLREAA